MKKLRTMIDAIKDGWYTKGAILFVLSKHKDEGGDGMTEEEITAAINSLELRDQIKAMEIGERLKEEIGDE